ncbi:DUF6261 family protein [Streptococcus pneumoniae]
MIYTYGIKHLAVRGLDNENFLQLMIESRDAIASFVKEHAVEAVYPKQLEEFSTVLERFRTSLISKSTSKAVQDLEMADRERDVAVLTLSNLIRAFSRVTEPATKAAYETLSAVLKEHMLLVNDSYENASAKISHLLKALATGDCQKAFSSLYLTAYLDQLTVAHETFECCYKTCLQEEKGQLTSQIKPLRAQLLELYNFFVDFTAIMVSAYPDRAELKDLRNQLNIIRKHYKKRKPVNGGGKEAQSETSHSANP